jgi:hypothetical protein
VRRRERKKAVTAYYMAGDPIAIMGGSCGSLLFLLPPSCHSRHCDHGVVTVRYHGWNMRQRTMAAGVHQLVAQMVFMSPNHRGDDGKR